MDCNNIVVDSSHSLVSKQRYFCMETLPISNNLGINSREGHERYPVRLDDIYMHNIIKKNIHSPSIWYNQHHENLKNECSHILIQTSCMKWIFSKSHLCLGLFACSFPQHSAKSSMAKSIFHLLHQINGSGLIFLLSFPL